MTVLTKLPDADKKSLVKDKSPDVQVPINPHKLPLKTPKRVKFDLPEIEKARRQWRLFTYGLCGIFLAAMLSTIAYREIMCRWMRPPRHGAVHVFYKVHHPPNHPGKFLDRPDYIAQPPFGQEIPPSQHPRPMGDLRGPRPLPPGAPKPNQEQPIYARAEEWFEVEQGLWKLESRDPGHEYTILTDLDTDRTVVRMTSNEEGEEIPACYVAKPEDLGLPHPADIEAFLAQVETEADMIVTGVPKRLFFDIGQPMDLPREVFGERVHRLCQGVTAYPLIPVQIENVIRGTKMDQVVEPKNVPADDNEASAEKTIEATQSPSEATTDSPKVTDPPAVPAKDESEPLSGSQIEDLGDLSNQLFESLAEGDLFGTMELMGEFHRLVAFLPSGSYSLHSPQGRAMTIHIRRQNLPMLLPPWIADTPLPA